MIEAIETTKIPIIRIRNTNLIVSIQVPLTDSLVRHLRDDITNEIEQAPTSNLIIDITGTDIMDSYISRAIRNIASVSRLMGVETLLCGINPMIAMTLVEMGMELEGIKTALDLDSALEALGN